MPSPRNFLAALALALVLPAAAQPHGASADAHAQLARLSKLVGTWKGSGSIHGREGPTTFTSEERAEMRLDGHAMVIEGLHRDASGRVVHQAIGVLAWDVARGEYRFGTALASGATGSHSGRIEDGRFIWTLEGTGPQRRFVIPLAGEDTWEEYGEISFDGGKTWRRFFEMRLERVR